MRILLIAANVARSPQPVYPLGLSIVAQALHEAGHRVFQFDFLRHDESLDALDAALTRHRPDLVGISIRNLDNASMAHEVRYLPAAKLIVARIRQRTRAPIVLGGSAFSLMPEEILRDVGGDYGIVGEGESAFAAFVAQAAQGVFPRARCVRSSVALAGSEIPSARYDRALMRHYASSGASGSVQTKRGCPHGCVYCTYPLLEGNVIRHRDARAVVDDMQRLSGTFKVRHIFFTDAVFNDGEGRYLDVIREIVKREVRIPWTAFFRPSGLTDAQMALMKRAGLAAADIGSDAATDATLRGLGKSFTYEDIVACNALCARHGVAASHSFMFGGPGETPATVRDGIEHLVRLPNTVAFVFMGIRILPGTPLARRAVADGVLAEDQSLLAPAYYLAPGIDRQWLEATLRNAFAGVRHCVFPPDSLDRCLRCMHSLGYAGSMRDLLNGREERKRRQERHAVSP